MSSRDSHYKKQADERGPVFCPLCGERADETQTRYGVRSSHCGLWSWDRFPLVDAATHEARKRAHAAFDELWKGRLVSRSGAYRRLAEIAGKKEIHMKTMSQQEADKVPGWVSEIRKELR